MWTTCAGRTVTTCSVRSGFTVHTSRVSCPAIGRSSTRTRGRSLTRTSPPHRGRRPRTRAGRPAGRAALRPAAPRPPGRSARPRSSTSAASLTTIRCSGSSAMLTRSDRARAADQLCSDVAIRRPALADRVAANSATSSSPQTSAVHNAGPNRPAAPGDRVLMSATPNH
jgi:hypothetical protein